MDISNLQNQIGFVNKVDIAFRLNPFNLPEGECFIIKRIEGSSFSQVGATFMGETLKFFDIYTGNEDVCKFVVGLLCEVAEELGKEFKDETGRSVEVVEVS